MRTRIKICGITRVEDALSAVAHGADAIGLVFYAPSPRHVTIDRAVEIVAQLPPFVDAVGLFVDASTEEVEIVRDRVKLDLLQFHGHETRAFCEGFRAPYIKAIRVRPETNLVQYAADFPSAKALLLDAYQEGVAGGTGTTFDWDLIPSGLQKPIILAGGLSPLNVAEAIRRTRPYAVDVSGGVERAKGIKDEDKVSAFIREVFNGQV